MPVSTKRRRTPRQIWGVSALVLLPVVVLIGLAASAAGSIDRSAPEAPVGSTR